MNKILSKLFFIIIFFSFAITAKAGSLSINANKSVVMGNSIKVSVNISDLAGRFKVTSSDQSVLAGGAEDWYEDSFTVTFSAKKVGSATITVTAVDVADMDTEEAFTGSRSVTINVTGQSTKQEIDINKKYSSDNYLKELSIDEYELSPTFNKDTLEYTVSLDYDVEKINVIGKANDTKANVKGLGEIKVNEGSNNIEIVVTAENGNERVYKINAVVEDNTWFMAGSLSQMRLAGVSEEEVNAYIQKHYDIAANAGVDVPLYEGVVRDDLEEKMTDRDDLDAIPVICMGYFGGWYYDPYELIEQQQKILDTYNQHEKFLILGLYPEMAIDTDYYDSVLSEAWGAHYVSLSQLLNGAAISDEGREQIAQIVYDKMVELGYLDASAAVQTETAETTEAAETAETGVDVSAETEAVEGAAVEGAAAEEPAA